MSTESITVTRARELILGGTPRIPAAETVPLSEAIGRVTARAVQSAFNIPPFTNSAMDGFAFRMEEVAHLEKACLHIAGNSHAGNPCKLTKIPPLCCVSITTGAPLPPDLDTVIPVEYVTLNDRTLHVSFHPADVRKGANVRYMGENIRPDDQLLAAGKRITPRDIALLASVGISSVLVYQKPRVSLITTGDELTEPGQPLAKSHIYNSNGAMLKSMLEELGCVVEYSGTLRDSPNEISLQLRTTLPRNHMAILTGGAGNGRLDISQTQVRALGTIEDWSINMRPGRPMRFGHIHSKPVFVLPGNPVASFVTFLEFVRPAIRYMQGMSSNLGLPERRAVLATPLTKKAGRAEFMRGRIAGYYNGAPVVEPLANQSSAALVDLANADVIICLDHETTTYEKGDQVRVQLLSEANF